MILFSPSLIQLRMAAALSCLVLAAAAISSERRLATGSEKRVQMSDGESSGTPGFLPNPNRGSERSKVDERFDRPFEFFSVERTKLLNNAPMAVDFSGRVTEGMVRALAMTDTEVVAVSAATEAALDRLKRAEASRVREPDETELAGIKENLDAYGMMSLYQGKDILYLPQDREGKKRILGDLQETLEPILEKDRTKRFLGVLRNEAVFGLSSIDQIFIFGGSAVRVQQWREDGFFEYGRNYSGPSMERYSYLSE